MALLRELNTVQIGRAARNRARRQWNPRWRGGRGPEGGAQAQEAAAGGEGAKGKRMGEEKSDLGP